MPDLKLVIDEKLLKPEDIIDKINYALVLSYKEINEKAPLRHFTANIARSKIVEKYYEELNHYDNEIKHHDHQHSTPKALKEKNSEHNKLLAKISKQESADRQDAINIAWFWSTFKGKPNFSCSDNNKLLLGAISAEFAILQVYEGGGLMWLEPFYINSEPVNKPPNGIFISLKGQPKILSAQWREYSVNNDGAKITESKKFNQKVQLHIYTEGLYGQDIEIKLKDHDFFMLDPDDKLSVKTIEQKRLEHHRRVESELKLNAQKENKKKILIENPSIAKKEAAEEEAQEEEKQSSANNHYNYFTREVDVFILLDDERDENKRMIISDSGESKLSYVQKTVLTVYLDPIWAMKINQDGDNAGHHLNIYPLIKEAGLESNFKPIDAYLSLKIDGETLPAYDMDGNTPVVTGTLHTNASDFNQCKFDKIKLTIKANQDFENKTREVILYNGTNNEKEDLLRKNGYTDIVLGAKEYGKKIIISLDGIETLSCEFNPHHTNHVITVPNLINSNNSALIKKADEYNGMNFFKVAEPIKISPFNTAESPFPNNFPEFKIPVPATDKELVLNLSYPYPEIPPNLKRETARHMIKYLLPLPYALIPYTEIPIQTCRITRVVKLRLYPDIKFTLSVGLNLGVEKGPQKSKIMEGIEHRVTKIQKAVFDFAIPKGLAKYIEGAAVHKVEIAVKLKAEYNKRTGVDTYNNEVDFVEYVKEYWEDKMKKVEILWIAFDRLINSNKHINNREERTLLSAVEAATKREPYTAKLIPPSMMLYLTWEMAEGNTPKAKELHRDFKAGYVFHGGLNFDPLIGASLTIDILGLIASKHPICKAVIAIIDLLGELAEVKLDLSLKITGTIGLKGDFMYNALTGENSANQRDLTTSKAPILEASEAITFTFNGSITANTKIPVFWFSNIISKPTSAKEENDKEIHIDGYAIINAHASATISQQLKYTDGSSFEDGLEGRSGMYLDVGWHFDGLVLKYGADVNVSVQPNDDSSKNEKRLLEKELNPLSEIIILEADKEIKELFKWFL